MNKNLKKNPGKVFNYSDVLTVVSCTFPRQDFIRFYFDYGI